MPVVSNVAAMYGTIENNTDDAVQLVGASSERCAEMRVHETNIEDGVMSMSDVDEFGLVVDAGRAVVMEPNGLHLMCLGTDSPLIEGDRVSVTLVFASGETVEGTVAVEQR